MPVRSRIARRPDLSASVVLTSFATENDAAALARVVVEERLAACGTCVPGARSIYRWKGAIEDAREVVLSLKTTRAREAALVRRVRALHPYDVPEVLVQRVRVGNPAYGAWLAESVRARA